MQQAEPMDYLPPTCVRLHSLALRDPRRAVRLASRAYQLAPPNSPIMRAWAAYTLGVSYLAWERANAALPPLIEALDRFQQAHLPFAVLTTRAALLRQRYLAGTDGDLQAQLATLAGEADAMEQPLLAAQIRLVQIAHLNVLGRPDESLALCAATQDTVIAYGSQSDQAQLLRLLAMAACDSGDLDRAAAALEDALQRFQHIREPAGVTRCLFDRAWISQRRERYQEALADIDAAQQIAERVDLPLRIAFCEKNRGSILPDLGRYDEAFAASLRAWAIFVATGRHDYAAGCDLHMGNIAYYSGLFEMAEAAYQRAHQVYRQYRMVRMEAVSLRNQALASRARGEPLAAGRQLELLLNHPGALSDTLERAEVHFELARCFEDLGQGSQAERHWIEAEALFASQGKEPGVAQCRLERAWLGLELGHTLEAQAALLACEHQLVEQPIHYWRALYGLGRCAELQDDMRPALAYYQRAISMVTALRRRLTSEHASSGIFAQAQQLFIDGLRLAVRCDDRQAVLSIIEQQRALALALQLEQTRPSAPQALQEALAAAQQQLTAASPSMRDDALRTYRELLLRVRHSHPATSQPLNPSLDLAALRADFTQAFGDQWTVLLYAPLDSDMIIATLDPDILAVERCALTPALQRALERACQPQFRLFTYLDLPYHDGSHSKPWLDLEILGTQLIPAPVRAALHPERRLIIVPAGPLHVLPWSALRANGSWLCEQCIPQLLPSLHIWRTLARRLAEGTAALLVGISTFQGRAPELRSVAPALELVERYWPARVDRLEGQQATRDALQVMSEQGVLRAYRHLFLATHGQLVGANGLLAHLKLMDEDFLYDDITQLQLGGALVVLAACDGALGEVLSGEEVLSLSRAFLSSGARDVIASLWPVYDSTILDLLEPLYEALKAGADAPAALAYAQRQLIRRAQANEDILAALPFVWGGMSPYGAGVTRSLST
jgi:tetratricopeptide (TPR) repeat protein